MRTLRLSPRVRRMIAMDQCRRDGSGTTLRKLSFLIHVILRRTEAG